MPTSESKNDDPHLQTFDPEQGLSSGSTLLNLAITGQHDVAFPKGRYFFFVGDSESGKTFFSMTCFAEATLNPAFDDYRFIYDNIEDGCNFNLDQLFNEDVADRVESPAELKDGTPVYSDTVESFYFHLDDAIKDGRPFIYVLDSMDSLGSEPADKKFEQRKKLYRKRTKGEKLKESDKVAGSYGDGKAKYNSEYLRKALKGLKKSQSILIIISQTRDNIGSMFGGKTRSGGRALRFYASVEVWTSVVETLKKTVNGKARKVGARVAVDVRKNRFTGRHSAVEVDFYPDYGFDDTGSCVDYLVEEKVWSVKDGVIKAEGLGLEAKREKLIRQIESKGLVLKLRALCGQCWKDILDQCAIKRTSRYQKETA